MTPPQHIAPPADGIPMPRRIWAILAVAFGVSLSVIDSTIANVALPTISRALGISSADSIWVVNAYQLAIVVSLLSFSALGDLVGYRKIYIGGLALFTAASVGCALSQSLRGSRGGTRPAGIRRGGRDVGQYHPHPHHLPPQPPRARHGHQRHGGGRLLRGGSDAGRRRPLGGRMAVALRRQYPRGARRPRAEPALPARQSGPGARPPLRLARRRDERPRVRTADGLGRGILARTRSADRRARRGGAGPRRLRIHPPPVARAVPDPAVRPAAHPDLLGLGADVDLLVPRTDARHGGAALLPATRLRLRRRGHRPAAHGLARGHHGRGPRGRAARRTGPRRPARRNGPRGDGRGAAPAGFPARTPHRLRNRVAARVVRCGIRAVPVAQQQHPDRLGASRAGAARPAECSPRPVSWDRPREPP